MFFSGKVGFRPWSINGGSIRSIGSGRFPEDPVWQLHVPGFDTGIDESGLAARRSLISAAESGPHRATPRADSGLGPVQWGTSRPVTHDFQPLPGLLPKLEALCALDGRVDYCMVAEVSLTIRAKWVP